MKSRMVNGYLIESGIPIPEPDRSRAGRPRKYGKDLETLKAGQFILFKGKQAYRNAVTVQKTARYQGISMAISSKRTARGQVVRLTRIT